MSMEPCLQEIRARVIENQEKLNNCKEHEFISIEKGNSCMQLQVICKNCGGRVNKDQAIGYAEGLKHGRLLYEQKNS